MDYKVKGESLTAIADGFRSSRGTTESLSLEEMAVLAAEKTGGGYGYSFDNAVSIHVEQPTVFAGSSPTPAQFVENVNLGVEVGVESKKIFVVEAVEGATYGFALSGGYWVSQNKGVNSSYAMCKVLFTFEEETTVTLKCINYAEKGYDYGLISEIDTMLTMDSTADTDGVLKSFKGSSSSSAVDVPVTIPAGEHFVCVKFIKDASTNSNDDSLKFAVIL